MIYVTFLGTGTSQGIPIIGSDHPVCKSEDPRDKRLRVSVLIQWKSCNLVIDCGPDFRQQMLRENVKHIDGIFSLMNMLIIAQEWMIFGRFISNKVTFQYLE